MAAQFEHLLFLVKIPTVCYNDDRGLGIGVRNRLCYLHPLVTIKENVLLLTLLANTIPYPMLSMHEFKIESTDIYPW